MLKTICKHMLQPISIFASKGKHHSCFKIGFLYLGGTATGLFVSKHIIIIPNKYAI